jgi:glutamate-1-semialdehyde 2,1-aminomutase
MANSKLSWNERSKKVIAQNALTYSKRSTSYIEGVYPTHYDGVHLHFDNSILAFTDEKTGDKFTCLDMTGALGINVLDVNDNCSAFPSVYEVQLAEMLKRRIPVLEKMRFLKTGSDATEAAVRIARAYTGKDHVYGANYHGWHNTFISEEKPGTGTVFAQYRKFSTVKELLLNLKRTKASLAGVIVEPVILDVHKSVKNDLKELRKICTELGIVLIFDEVVTGFRVPHLTVTNWWGIEPDLLCLGKALGHGHPVSVVGGKKKIMDTEGWFISTTFAGEARPLISAIDFLEEISHEKIMNLWHRGIWFKHEFNKLSPKLQLHGIPTRLTWVAGNDEFKWLFWQEMCKRHYLFGVNCMLTLAHSRKLLVGLLADAKDVVKNINTGKVKLEGKAPQPAFVRYQEGKRQ